ncbi:MAG: hypothetical protein ABJD07_00565 [Gemmatimonadaceae bacterium]
MSRWYLTETDYPAVRRVMGPERERLDDEALESVLEEVFPGAEPEHVEDFMQTLQQFGKQAAPVVQKVGPGAAQGAAQGAALGPYGALFGALAGGASSLIGGGATSAPPSRALPSSAPALAPTPSTVAPTAVSAASAAVPVAAQPPAPSAVGAAPTQLLSFLSRPETMQALLALAMAEYGRTTVSVGQHQVPATEFASAISELAAEAAVSGNGPSSYWYDPHGAPRCDIANPFARAALLCSDLSNTAATESSDWAADGDRWSDVDEALESNDALESFEAALAGDEADDY